MFDFKRIDRFTLRLLDNKYSGAGIYMMVFPNGMRYLGKSKHINKRIRKHFYDFLVYKEDWHSKISPLFITKEDSDLYKSLGNVKTIRHKNHPDWKVITAKRKEILNEELEEENLYKQRLRYDAICEFLFKVELRLWVMDEDEIDQAEKDCLHQIVKEGKRDRYYNTIFYQEVN